MILWTIQPVEAWEECERRGTLRTRLEHVDDDHYVAPYRWMIDQMRERIGPPPEPDLFPIWAWLQWEGQNRRKPDLRAARWWVRKGTRHVRIEFECAECEALLSDFEQWHYPLNHWYLPRSEADAAEFEKQFPFDAPYIQAARSHPDPEYQERIRSSWVRMFDLDWVDPYISSPLSEKAIQATLWELRRESVRDVREFAGAAG